MMTRRLGDGERRRSANWDRMLAGVVALLAAPLANAQNITGTITGVVSDPSGAGVPEAPVIGLNTETGISYKTTTEGGGVYVLPLLPVGTYQVSIEAQGFRKLVLSGLTLGGDERLRADARLVLGAVAETVTVSGGPPLVTTDQGHARRKFLHLYFQ